MNGFLESVDPPLRMSHQVNGGSILCYTKHFVQILQQATEAKLSSQEVFWSAKFRSLSREHEEEMGRVRAEVELMRASAESARGELEREMAARNNNQVKFCQQPVCAQCSEHEEHERAA